MYTCLEVVKTRLQNHTCVATSDKWAEVHDAIFFILSIWNEDDRILCYVVDEQETVWATLFQSGRNVNITKVLDNGNVVMWQEPI